MEARVRHAVVVIELNRDLGVAFDSRNRIDNDAFCHGMHSRWSHVSAYPKWGRPPLEFKGSDPLRIGSLAEFAVMDLENRLFSLEKSFEHAADSTSRRRTAGEKVINWHNRMH